jgi:hypothetical protein
VAAKNVEANCGVVADPRINEPVTEKLFWKVLVDQPRAVQLPTQESTAATAPAIDPTGQAVHINKHFCEAGSGRSASKLCTRGFERVSIVVGCAIFRRNRTALSTTCLLS